MVDRYTKSILTMIAICLAIIAVRGTETGKAVAQSGPVHVVIDSVERYAFKYTQPLAVECRNCQ